MIFCLSDYHRDPLSTSVQKTFQAVFNPVWETVLQKSKLGITRSQSPIQIYKCLCDILSFISVAQIWGSRLLTISAVLWATETILELRNRGDTQEKLRRDKVTFRCVSPHSVTWLTCILCSSSFGLSEPAGSLLRPNPSARLRCSPYLRVGDPSLPPAKPDLLGVCLLCCPVWPRAQATLTAHF